MAFNGLVYQNYNREQRHENVLLYVCSRESHFYVWWIYACLATWNEGQKNTECFHNILFFILDITLNESGKYINSGMFPENT